MSLTLNDGQQDDDDKEEEGDVENHPIEFILIPCWVLNLVSYASTCSHTHVHVEQITLWRERDLLDYTAGVWLWKNNRKKCATTNKMFYKNLVATRKGVIRQGE